MRCDVTSFPADVLLLFYPAYGTDIFGGVDFPAGLDVHADDFRNLLGIFQP
jgi:hypothetical protein